MQSEYSLFVKTVQSTAIRSLFETLKEILHDVNFTWDTEGVKLLTMDGARCACVFLKLNAGSFDEYVCAEPITTGLNMAVMFKLLKACGNNDTVTIFIRKDSPHELGITINNSEKNSQTTYKAKLLDCDIESLELPNMDFENIITLPAAYFQKLTRDMSNLSDTLEIVSQGSVLTLRCEGSYASQETVIGETDGCMAAESNTDTEISGKYSLRYLSLFSKASNLAASIQLFLKTDWPLVLQYQCASLGVLRFCIAQKLD